MATDTSPIHLLIDQAMREPALRYHFGQRGVAPNLDEALRWCTTARDGGGLFLLGCEYCKGTRFGSNRDAHKAVSAWAMAADLGNPATRWWRSGGFGVCVECDKPRAASLYTAIAMPKGCNDMVTGAVSNMNFLPVLALLEYKTTFKKGMSVFTSHTL
ncbi:hypothetical protein Pelo_18909 [Pelomyxa schiedti]|nr:hypothetical protein Pelo_18909 [Pelomyxa schiedti]